MTVSGESDNVDYRGHEIGSHNFAMNWYIDGVYPCPLMLPTSRIKIDTVIYYYEYSSSEKLKIDQVFDLTVNYIRYSLVKIK